MTVGGSGVPAAGPTKASGPETEAESILLRNEQIGPTSTVPHTSILGGAAAEGDSQVEAVEPR